MNLNVCVKRILISTLIVLCFFTQAYAISLDQAKAQGKVGELQSGYLAPVKNDGDREVNNLVNDINSKRKEHYQKIAKDSGTSLTAVEVIAGKKAIAITAKGNYIQDASGKMVVK